MVNDVLAVFYLLVFASLVYMIKSIVDSERVLQRHPYFRNYLLRFFFTINVACPLALVITPEYTHLINIAFAGGISGAFTTVGWIYNRHILRVGITLTDTPSTLVSAVQYLNFHSDRYEQLSNGVFVRRLVSATDVLKDEYEALISDKLHLFDFSEVIVLSVRFDDSAIFPEHFHKGYEDYVMIEGVAKILPNVTLHAGDRFRVEAETPHFFAGLSDGIMLVGLQKEEEL